MHILKLSFVVLVAFAARTVFAADGEVEFLVRGPDGKAAPNVQLQLSVADGLRLAGTVNATATTDAAGMARVAWPIGVTQIQIQAKNLGYTTSGVVEILPGITARPTVPPLAPYARLSATLPENLGTPNTVYAQKNPGGDRITATSDAAGLFQWELPAGEWLVFAERGGTRVAQLPHTAYLAPGQSAKLTLIAAPPPASQPAPAPPAIAELQEITWARGEVRDVGNKPIAGATVHAVAIYHGGLRMYEDIITTTAGPNGEYHIRGPYHSVDFSATLLATAPGYAPAWAWIQKPTEAPINLIVAERSGKLDVTILMDGKLAPGKGVRLFLEGANLRNEWARGGGESAWPAYRAAYPFAVTDANGIARFDHLLPGRYKILAGQGENELFSFHAQPFSRKGILGEANGVPVRIGDTGAFRMSIYDQSFTAGVNPYRHDGFLLAGQHYGLSYGRFEPTISRSSWSSDAVDFHQLDFPDRGLWAAEFRYREVDPGHSPLDPPYFAVGGIAIVSPSIPPNWRAEWHARRVEPGTLRVQVLDAEGKPARGVVEIATRGIAELASVGSVLAAGSTDENGEIFFGRFPTIPAGHVEARFAGSPLSPTHLFARNASAPIPADDTLTRVGIVPQPVVVSPNRETRITMRAEPLGWIKGNVVIPPGGGWNFASVFAAAGQSLPDVAAQYHAESREFVAGPIGGNRVKLGVYTSSPRGDARRSREIAVTPGRVMYFDLRAAESPPLAPAYDRFLVGPAGLSLPPPADAAVIPGEVFLPDRQTFAAGAHVYLFPAEQLTPILAGAADARGIIRSRPLRFARSSAWTADHFAEEPVAIALLPGSHGAAIAPIPAPGAPIRFVLPAPLSLKGVVQVGNAPPNSNHHIQVRAAYQGRGKLNEFLSVEATADADGRFELAGLTPGTYQLQAALDNIWLSSTVHFEANSQPLDAAQLRIPAPGAPVIVKLVNAAGQPLSGPVAPRTIALERAAGPFSHLWPREWTTDPTGALQIPTLESGRHTLKIPSLNLSHEFQVPPLPAEKPLEILLRVQE